MTPGFKTVRIQPGVYRVDVDREGRYEIVYVAGSQGTWWAFWDGQVFRLEDHAADLRDHKTPRRSDAAQSLFAPMPATVVKILAVPGTPVQRGDTLVVLEAMKMELPIRATGDGTVTAVYCREGELVQPDSVLVELT